MCGHTARPRALTKQSDLRTIAVKTLQKLLIKDFVGCEDMRSRSLNVCLSHLSVVSILICDDLDVVPDPLEGQGLVIQPHVARGLLTLQEEESECANPDKKFMDGYNK